MTVTIGFSPITQLTLLAHRIQQAAHEGVVPLCEEYIWNPQLPWVSAQWTHEAAREGRVRLGYPSKEGSGGILWECLSISVGEVALGGYLLQLAQHFETSHGISSDVFHFWRRPKEALASCWTWTQTSDTCSLPSFGFPFFHRRMHGRN